MALFGPKETCENCGSSVRKPRDANKYLCPKCNEPGPWATEAQIQTWTEWKADQERQEGERKELERREALERQERRRQELETAASLTPLEVPGFVPHKKEAAYFHMPGNLAERKKSRGHYEGGGGLRGVSFRIPGAPLAMRGIFGGLSQRTYVPGEESWQLVDSGTIVVTSKRLVFMGQTKAVEWRFDKLLGLNADRSNNCLVIQVSNRQKAHVVQVDDFELFEAAIEAAIDAQE